MAIRNPFVKSVAKTSEAQAALKQAAEDRLRREIEAAERAEAEEQTVTHQGPGTGQVPDADPSASGAILRGDDERGDENSADGRVEFAQDPRASTVRAATGVFGKTEDDPEQASNDPDAVDENVNALFKSGSAEDSTASIAGTAESNTSRVEKAVDSAVKARDPFDRVAEGRDVTGGTTPTAVTDNDAETIDIGLGGGRTSSKKEVEVADSGVDAGVKPGPRSRADEFGIGSSTSEGQSGRPGNPGAEVGSSGNQGAIDAVTAEIESAKGQERDVASELLGAPNINPGAGNEGNGQRLFDLQFASAELAIANAQATETEPSVAADGTLKELGDTLAKTANTITGAVGVAGLGGLSAEGAALGLGVAAEGAVGAGTAAGVIANVAVAGGAGVVIAGAAGFAAGTLAVESGLADFEGTRNAIVSLGEESKQATESKAEVGRAQGRANKQAKEEEAERQRRNEAALKKAEEEAKRKAEEEAKKKAEEEAKKEQEEAAKNEKGGGVKTTPGDDRPTEEEFLLGQQIKAELGFRRIAGDIDFGEGDGTNTGTKSEGNLSAADAIILGGSESLVGQPGGDGEGKTAPAPSLGQGNPGFGGSEQGGDIDFEDGTGFTGGTRSEDINDISFGPSAPLVGFPRDDDGDDNEKDD